MAALVGVFRPHYAAVVATAAAIIIGDEILSGKVRDTNAHCVIQLLQELGVQLLRIATVGDDPTCIAEEINRCRERCTHVITSGGVGPTHDDRTMEGVAQAFGRELVRHPDLEQMVRHHWKDRVNEAALKLSEVPDGARLLASDDGMLPAVQVENVFILPGIPQLFEAKLRRLRQELSGGTAWIVLGLYLSADESSIAEFLSQVDDGHPEVKIGSYPRLDDADYRVHVTVESQDRQHAEQALDRLLGLLDPEWVVRTDRG